MADAGDKTVLLSDGPAGGLSWPSRVWRPVWRAVLPVLLALCGSAVILLCIGRDPLSFYATTFQAGLFSWVGLEEVIIRLAPLLLMSAGLIVAFQAGLWNIGGDGQFLMAAALVGGLGPTFVAALPLWAAWTALCLVGFIAGAAWTVVPSFLKAWYGMNEIISVLMMSYIGINLANVLIKGPFLSEKTLVPQTDVVPFEDLLPYLPGTQIHIGIVIALVVLVLVHVMQRRTAYGLRLRVLGTSPKAAVHAGIPVKRDIITAFGLSGGLIGLAAAVEVLGVWGYVRADWNPAFGMTLFAIVFLADLNVLLAVPLVFFFAVIQIGGHVAARQAGLPNDFLLLLIGLILFCMVLVEWLRDTGRLGRLSRRRKAIPAGDGAAGEEAVTDG